MKRAQRTDLIREMRKSFNRYISILLIMALGVAFYAGVRSSEPDMQLSAKKYFDSTNYMDIRVIGTMGLTEEDVTALGNIYGVDQVEGGYQTELFLEAGQRDYQMSVYSLGDVINQVHVNEGRIPSKQDECFMDSDFMTSCGYSIGDKITLSAEEDTEFSDVLYTDTFTIVGSGCFPNYLSWQRGAVSIGTGVEDGFLFLPKEAFAMEFYTVVYATVENAKDYNPFTEEYEDYIALTTLRMENIADVRCADRYEEVTGPYWEDIFAAEAEMAEAEKEIADGEKKIADGENEIVDAEIEIADAEKELADGEKELADAEKELADAEEELIEGEQQLADAENELASAEAELLEGEQQIADAEEELAAGEAAFAEAEKKINEGEEELARTEEELKNGEAELETATAQLTLQEAALAQGEAELAAAIAQLEAYGLPMTPELLAMETELESGRQQLQAAKEQLEDIRLEIEFGWTQVEAGKLELVEGQKELEAARIELEEGRKGLEAAKAELADGRKAYEDGLAEYEKAKQEWLDGWKKYEDGLAEYEQGLAEFLDGREALETARYELEDAKLEIQDAKGEIEEGKKELEEGKQELEDARKELEKIEMPEWYVLDRGTVQQIVEYGSNTERIGKLGNVFPAVFYLVAALVSLTTMTRMIEEERTQIGTMKALGYGKRSIVSKYLWYSLSATLLGGIFGVLVGSFLFPWVIMKAYGILYSNVPYLITPIQWELSVMSVLIAVVCTVVATMSSCYKELTAAPAILMRPEAPAAGRRVFLEYVKPLWNALSFSWKATCRNLFRYKKRFFMTIFGIGGCMALLLVGFGLRDSIMEIVSKQYKEIWTYDAYLSINDTEISMEEKEHGGKVENQMFIQTKSLDVESEESLKSATLFVPETLENLANYVKLQDRVTEESYTLGNDGVIISEKLAKLLEVSEGDTIELYFDDVTKYPVEITAVAENYMMHYVYMSADMYRTLFGEEPEFNQLYLKTVDMTEAEQEAFSSEMLSDTSVDSITYVEELQESVAVMMQSMEMVIVVLIVAAGMLAFIVLYNLNNINIIERRRELATLKVLGFYDMEVGSYVYRENVLLTIFGILAGVLMGFFLHRFVILTVEVDMMMFGREIGWPSYVYSVLLTCVFALFINFGMFFKLRKIDMASSLKSAE